MSPFKTKHFPTFLTYLSIFFAAVSTNHSLGEVVYKKSTNLAINHPDESKRASGSAIKTPLMEVTDVFSNEKGEFLVIKRPDRWNVQFGTLLDINRLAHGQRVKTGTAKVEKVNGNYILAKVRQSPTSESSMLLNDYPMVMIGDNANPKRMIISRTIHISPTKTISFHHLFADPNAYPNTFELSEKGKEVLREKVAVFQNSKLPKLIVEGHTDVEGESDVNQVESYQRALTIRQFLVQELKFDPERILAIGMGETEPLEEPYLPDHKRNARRIVLKAKAY